MSPFDGDSVTSFASIAKVGVNETIIIAKASSIDAIVFN